MTTNETSFFRDIHPFNALRDTVLPEIIERQRASRTLTIWCAAASSGQEPYSIAMLLRDSFPELRSWKSGEHTSELQSLMRSSYAVFCLKKKNKNNRRHKY